MPLAAQVDNILINAVSQHLPFSPLKGILYNFNLVFNELKSVFRDKPFQPSVVDVTTASGSASAADLDLFYDQSDKLIAEAAKPGTYTLAMSDGTRRTLLIERTPQTFAIESPWRTIPKDAQGYSVLQETTFQLPAGFGKGQRITLDLDKVSIMAKVTLNGHTFDTLWMPPFTLDVTDVLESGKNHLQVLVTSTSKGKPSRGKVVELRTTVRKQIKR